MTTDPTLAVARSQARWSWLVTAAVFASFLLVSAVRTPVPAVNEPHYLGKAKHFWDPAWCARDLLYESSDAHLVFYGTVGLLTKWLTLEQTAWVGRIIALLILAVGWTQLVQRVIPGRWVPLWGSWLFTALMALADWSKGWKVAWGDDVVRVRIIDFSGEWMVGGVEGKVFAYGFLFWAMGLALDRRFKMAAVLAGLSISFHPVVGVWGLAAATYATLSRWWKGRRVDLKTPYPPLNRVGDVLLPLCLLVLCSLPGVIPALLAVAADAEPWVAYRGTAIQVLHRLKHHLDPREFPLWTYLSFGGLIGLWSILRRWSARTLHEPWLAAFVDGTLLIAIAGLVIGFAAPPADAVLRISSDPDNVRLYPLGLTAMKFYPFRLAGIMIPIVCALALPGLAYRANGRLRWPTIVAWPVFVAAFAATLLMPAYDRNPTRLKGERLANWKVAGRWIDANTPPDALFLTPRSMWGFKWFAQRAEYVSPKDTPQDAAGIVEWWRRLDEIRDWYDAHEVSGLTAADLDALHAATGITHLLTGADPDGKRPVPPEERLIFQQGEWRVYRAAPPSD